MDISDKELEDTRMRIVQLWDRFFKDSQENKVGTLSRGYLVNKYKLLVTERVKNRHILLKRVHAIDQYIFDTSIFKLSVPNLGEMIIASDFCSLTGSFVKNPQKANDIDVILKLPEEQKDEALEKKLREFLIKTLEKQEGKKERQIEFIYSAAIPDSSYIPLYDLILKPKEIMEVRRIKKKISIKKPEEIDDKIHIPVSPECEVTATINISEEEGITALYCGKIKRIRTFIFDKKKKAWTMSSAKAWVKLHKKEIQKKLESEYEKESKKIRENSKTVKFPHKFKAAKFTHKNGHPRCILCGDEETLDGICVKTEKAKEALNFICSCIECNHVIEVTGKHCRDVICPKCGGTMRRIERPGAGEKVLKKEISVSLFKVSEDEQIVGGIVYEPMKVDSQKDFATAKEIKDACYYYMENARQFKLQHKGEFITEKIKILENYLAPVDFEANKEKVKKGSWILIIRVLDNKIWKDIKEERITGFSMAGIASRRKIK